jgi:hypothetical protein
MTKWTTERRVCECCPVRHAVCFVPAQAAEHKHTLEFRLDETQIDAACELATKLGARLTFTCETEGDAAALAHYVTARLPEHRRLPLERLEAQAFGRLN